MIKWLTIIILSLAPISELRGAIPAGIAFGFSPISIFLIAVFFNAIAFFPIYFGLKYFYKYVKNNNLITRIVERARRKGHKPMEKYGVWGLILFVAIPLPLTGAWTATIISWLFDVEWWKSFAVIATGVIIAGIIVTLSSMGAIQFLQVN